VKENEKAGRELLHISLVAYQNPEEKDMKSLRTPFLDEENASHREKKSLLTPPFLTKKLQLMKQMLHSPTLAFHLLLQTLHFLVLDLHFQALGLQSPALNVHLPALVLD